MKLVSINKLETQSVSHNSSIKKKVILEKGELGNITNFSRAVFPVGEVATRHKHDDMGEVFWVQAGNGKMRINEKEFELSTDMCVVVEPGEYHEIQNTGNEELKLVYFGVAIDE
ncbi:MAG: cupin domain-containing protein [Gammaproteobacteria bacterium]|nr:cupin domain-containing protein [Gammaproteobacteria bacterium]